MMPSTVSRFLLALAIGGLAIGCLINPDDARAVPPPNDDFANAILLTGDAGSVSVSILEATRETNEPAESCEEEGTAWYKWVAPASGELSVTTPFGVYTRNCADIYVGTSVDTLSIVVGKSSFFGRPQTGGAIEETVGVQVGKTYYIQASSKFAIDFDFDFGLPDAEFSYTFTQSAVNLVASVLPSSRSVQVGSLASAFATVINTSGTTATDCSIVRETIVAADFAYQITDASNVPVGSSDTPADIPAGGAQNFVFAFLPMEPIIPTEVLLIYDCTNSALAPVMVGLNTLLLSASATPVPDIVALVATATGDGIVDLPSTNGSNAFAIATVNVGSTATITASAVPSVALPLLVMSICETNSATGACLSAPASSATSSVGEGDTGTYSVFVTATGAVPFDPANNRINVKFRDAGGVVRGSTSVAVRTL